LESTPRLVVTDPTVAPVTVSEVPPRVTVGSGEQAVPEGTTQRDEPLMANPFGVPDAVVVTKTEEILGVAPVATDGAALAAKIDAIATAKPWLFVDIPYPLSAFLNR
jgi:hypothetical protein